MMGLKSTLTMKLVLTGSLIESLTVMTNSRTASESAGGSIVRSKVEPSNDIQLYEVVLVPFSKSIQKVRGSLS